MVPLMTLVGGGKECDRDDCGGKECDWFVRDADCRDSSWKMLMMRNALDPVDDLSRWCGSWMDRGYLKVLSRLTCLAEFAGHCHRLVMNGWTATARLLADCGWAGG